MVLSMTSSSSLSLQEEKLFLPLNLLQHSRADNTTERYLVRKSGGRMPSCVAEHINFLT